MNRKLILGLVHKSVSGEPCVWKKKKLAFLDNSYFVLLGCQFTQFPWLQDKDDPLWYISSYLQVFIAQQTTES